MIWELIVDGIEETSRIREQIDRRLSFALSRFGSKISRTSVHLTDLNGPKGGIDKQCKIVLALRGVQPVIVEVIDTSWPAAIDRAANRLGQTVQRVLERSRMFPRERATPRSDSA